jgi:formylglycine-generating enzyme required for sulfatase activity
MVKGRVTGLLVFVIALTFVPDAFRENLSARAQVKIVPVNPKPARRSRPAKNRNNRQRKLSEELARAQQLREEADWNRVRESNDPDDFRIWLRKYPAGKFAAEARARWQELEQEEAWLSIRNSQNPDSLRSFLQRFPEGKYAVPVEERLLVLEEKLFWQQAESSRNPEEAEAYLQKYPNGLFVESARRKIRELSSELRTCDFETVTVNHSGQIVRRSRTRARCLAEYLDKGIRLELIEIPAGTFTRSEMQTASDSRRGKKNQPPEPTPDREVKIPAPFYLGRFEVTQEQWRAVAEMTEFRVKMDLRIPPLSPGANMPVGNITWAEAMEFCARLSRKTGRLHRLPTEAEWEYACRAGTTTPYAFGETLTPTLANFGFGSPSRSAVGWFDVANAFGLFDMHGNMLEWCLDDWHDTLTGAPTDGTAWMNDKASESGVLRGGAFLFPASSCNSAWRYKAYRTDGATQFGFRVVMSDAPAQR